MDPRDVTIHALENQIVDLENDRRNMAAALGRLKHRTNTIMWVVKILLSKFAHCRILK